MKHCDVTGITVYFSLEQINKLLASMTPEQRRFAQVLAKTIQNPHEIWKAMREDEESKGQWHWVRSYVQYLDFSESDTDADFGVAVMEFVFRSRWELKTVGLLLDKKETVMAKLNNEIRSGDCEYSANQH